MKERIGFTNPDCRNEFFSEVKKSKGAETWKGLASSLKLYRTLFQKYKYGQLLIPSELFNAMLALLPEEKQAFFRKQIFAKPLNWGTVKGGTKAWKTIFKKYTDEPINNWRSNGGKASIRNLRIWMNYAPKKRYFLLRQKKLKKGWRKIKINETDAEKNLKKKEIIFDISRIEFSGYDKKRRVTIPEKLSPLLAEDIGIHLGDGTLSKKYYFSARGGFDEEKYYTEFVLPLYKKLYNIEPPLLKRNSACGFEISSKAIYQFKNKIIGIPTGVKTYRLTVPECILESEDKDILRAFVRGLVDTDGCYYFREKQYPIISLCIKSKELIEKVRKILLLLGFSPQIYLKGYTLSINGIPPFKKWQKKSEAITQKT